MAREPSFTVASDIFHKLTVVVGNHVYIGQGDQRVVVISRTAGGSLARGLLEHLTPAVDALTDGQQYEQDYTPGADKAREIVSWLESGETRNRVYRMVRDALNEGAALPPLSQAENLTVRRLQKVVDVGFAPRPDGAHVNDVKDALELIKRFAALAQVQQ